MYIQELARRIRLRHVGDPKVEAVFLATLGVFNTAMVIHEIPRAIPPAVIVSKRSDDNRGAHVVDGPESRQPQLAATTVVELMPPGTQSAQGAALPRPRKRGQRSDDSFMLGMPVALRQLAAPIG